MLVSKPTSGLSLCARIETVLSFRKTVPGAEWGFFVRVRVRFEMKLFKSIRRIRPRAAPMNWNFGHHSSPH